MSNKLSRRAAPLANVFWGQGWFAQVWAQNGLIKKSCLGQEAVWAKSGVGQKWCGPKVVRKIKKHGKNKSKKRYPSKIMLKERKSNQNIVQTRKFFFKKIRKSKKSFAFSYSFSFCFFLFLNFCNLCDVLGFWSTQKSFCMYPKKVFCIPQESILSPKKVFCIPKKVFCPKMSTTFAERCIPRKSTLYPKKVAPGVGGGWKSGHCCGSQRATL